MHSPEGAPHVDDDSFPAAHRPSPRPGRKAPLLWVMIPPPPPPLNPPPPPSPPPSSPPHSNLVLGWLMCRGNHRLCRVADTAQPQDLRDHSRRHGLDTTYNFFARS